MGNKNVAVFVSSLWGTVQFTVAHKDDGDGDSDDENDTGLPRAGTGKDG